MRKSLILLIAVTSVLFSCGQESKSRPNIVTSDIVTFKTAENDESQKGVAISKDKYIDTKYEYVDSNGKHLIFENSLPKGGLKYTDPNGEEYIYAIFWTRIINETANPFELSIEAPADSFKVPTSSANYFKIFLPSAIMTVDKAPLFNYGLTDLDAILDNKLQKSSSLQRTINSKETSMFYVVTLFKQGFEGTVRAGFRLKDNMLYYRVKDKEIYCGSLKLKI